MRSPVACAFLADASSHSHTTNTVHPDACSSIAFCASRAMFFSNFSCQNCVLLLGVVAILQPECRCQKHPCTKTTVLYRGNTRSGLPGSPAPCNRYRSPSRWRTLRSASSGWVSLPLMRDILSERSAGERKSVIGGFLTRPALAGPGLSQAWLVSSKKGSPRMTSPATSNDL